MSIVLILVSTLGLNLQLPTTIGASPPSPDFAIMASPFSLTIPITGSGLVRVSLTSLNSFSGVVNLTASGSPSSTGPVDPFLVLGENNVSLSSYGSANTWLNITIQYDASYSIILSGTSGPLVHSVGIAVAPGAPQSDFAIRDDRAVMIIPRGLSDTDLITVTSLHLFSGPITVSETTTPLLGSGPSISFNPQSFTVSEWGSTATAMIVQTSGLTPLQNYTTTITATDPYTGQTHSLTVQLALVAQGFDISANPTTFTIGTSDQEGCVIKVVSLAGFAGNVTLSASVNPKAPGVFIAVAARMFPDHVSLSQNGVEYAVLIVTSFSVATSYDIIVQASHGALTRSLTLTVWVVTPMYMGYRTLSSLSVTSGSSNRLIINLTNQTGYIGPVTMNAIISPVVPNGPTISFEPAGLSLTSIGWNTTNLIVTAGPTTPLGVYLVVLDESSGTMKLNPIVLLLTVEAPIRFRMTVTPDHFALGLGTNLGTFQVSVTNLGQSPGQVAVSAATNPPDGLFMVLWRRMDWYYTQNDPLDVEPNSTVTLTIDANANNDAKPGNYTLTITGYSGNITSTTTVNITVFSLRDSYLSVSVVREGYAYPGSKITLVYNFTDLGSVSMTVQRVELEAFYMLEIPISNPVALRPGETKIIETSLTVPQNTAKGVQTLDFNVEWEFYNPITSQWTSAQPINFNGNITVYASVPTPPSDQPQGSISSQMATFARALLSITLQTFLKLLSHPATIILTGVTVWASLATLAVILALQKGRRPGLRRGTVAESLTSRQN